MNEKGLTLIELLVAFTILIMVMASVVQFYKHYAEESREFGDYLTAKHIAIDALEYSRSTFLESGSQSGTFVHQGVTNVNETNFEYIVTQEDITSNFAIYSADVEIRKLTARTKWKKKKLEVILYVSSP